MQSLFKIFWSGSWQPILTSSGKVLGGGAGSELESSENPNHPRIFLTYPRLAFTLTIPMSDEVEIPEVKDSFERRIAISIAIIAVLLSYIGMKGDNAKTDAIVKTNEASNKWGQYQANSMKEHLAEMEGDLLKAAANPDPKKLAELTDNAAKYHTQKEEIKKQAEQLQALAQVGSDMNDRCDFAALFLQIAVVICSVAILSRMRLFWFAGLILAAVGVVKFFL
jgi:hypothetical protein